MTINTTTWSPDTCGCTISYDWNTEQSENVRVHKNFRIVKVCDAHIPPELKEDPSLLLKTQTGLEPETLEDMLNEKTIRDPHLSNKISLTVLEENQRKNIALAHILENGPKHLHHAQAHPTEPNEVIKTLKPEITYKWEWTGQAPNRILNVSFEGAKLTNVHKNVIQKAINTRFGENKVSIG
jgi:hypothetical protein